MDSAWTVLGHILGTNRKGHPSEKQPHLLNVCHVFLRCFAFFFLANDVTPATLQKHPVTLPLSLPLSPSLSLSLSLSLTHSHIHSHTHSLTHSLTRPNHGGLQLPHRLRPAFGLRSNG